MLFIGVSGPTAQYHLSQSDTSHLRVHSLGPYPILGLSW
jgi:hypothetical protein